MKKSCLITILPEEQILSAYEGDSLQTLLLVAGLIDPEDPLTDRLRLEKGALSDAENPANEEAVFSAAEIAEGWLLASERRIVADAVLTVGEGALPYNPATIPLAKGFGLAVDIGTATIVAGLVNLDNMQIPLLTSVRNSQADIALEIDDRVAYCKISAENTQQMQELLRDDIDKAAEKLCNKAGISGSKVSAVVIVGNYLLTSILLRQLPPAAWAPLLTIIEKTAAEIGLGSLDNNTEIYFLPAASPEMGADTSAAVLAANLLHKIDDEKITIMIDLGMRGELVAAGRGKLLATSVPALPFDGAGLSHGMSARAGAITGITLTEDTVILRTVRDARPKGICGAGMLSIVYELLQADMIDAEGRLVPPKDISEKLASRFRNTISGKEFVLSYGDEKFADDICINQDDINQIQMAKGAVFAACKALLFALHAEEEDINEIFIAEASSANIRIEAALAIGLIPRIGYDKVVNIGNAAWQGAYLALSNRVYLEESLTVTKKIESLDLTSDLIYAEEFINAMTFDLDLDYDDE